MSEINVLIVDDHPVVCKGIRNLLEPAVGVKVAGEAHTGAEALQMVKALKPDVVLLDMRLPDMTGIEIIKEIYASGNTTRILGLSSYNDREFISQLLNHGASGYLLKDEMPDQILEAIRGVAHGESGWVSRKVAAMLSQIILREKEGGGTDLTPRELDVLSRIVQGYTNRQVADELKLSVRTVEGYRANLTEKLGLHNRADLVRYAREHGYLRNGEPAKMRSRTTEPVADAPGSDEEFRRREKICKRGGRFVARRVPSRPRAHPAGSPPAVGGVGHD